MPYLQNKNNLFMKDYIPWTNKNNKNKKKCKNNNNSKVLLPVRLILNNLLSDPKLIPNLNLLSDKGKYKIIYIMMLKEDKKRKKTNKVNQLWNLFNLLAKLCPKNLNNVLPVNLLKNLK